MPAPSVSDLQLCSSGGASLSVNNASPAITYRLYETENSAHQIDEQKGGRFNISVSANRSYFVTQLNGTCESPRAEVKITVGLSAINIANAFTPNGDGINDYWKISNIESYPGALVQVFSRYGQKVFESKGYSKPFDGTINGKKLPPGVYYYIINLNTNCNVLSGSLTVMR
jgi:gliding motility-associated-like protein